MLDRPGLSLYDNKNELQKYYLTGCTRQKNQYKNPLRSGYEEPETLPHVLGF